MQTTYNAIEYVERRLEIEMYPQAVHLQQSFEYERSQKGELRVIYIRVESANCYGNNEDGER